MKYQPSSGKPKKHSLILVRRVIGESMLPALRPGRVVIATSLFRRPDIGDVIIVEHQRLEKIKRVTKLRHNQVFVSGDNTLNSTDSRDFGWLPYSAIVAKIIWPR